MFTTLSFGPQQCPAGFTQTAAVAYEGVTIVSCGIENRGYNGDLAVTQLYTGSATTASAQVRNNGRLAADWLLWVVVYAEDGATVSADDAEVHVSQAPVRA